MTKKKSPNNKLFIKIARQVRKYFKEQNQPISWNEAQKFASKNIYPKYKGENTRSVTVKLIRKELDQITSKKKQSPCFNVFQISDADISAVEWWDLENTLETLPNNAQVRINGGSAFGMTIIDKVGQLSIDNDLNPIIDLVREFTNNSSGVYWEGKFKKVPDKPDNGENCNYFIDFVLTDDTGMVAVQEGEQEILKADLEDEIPEDKERFERTKKVQKKKKKTKSQKRKEAIQKRKQLKVKEGEKKTKNEGKQTKKSKEQEILKTKKLKEFNKALDTLQKLLDQDLISKKQFKESFDKITKNLGKGGAV